MNTANVFLRQSAIAKKPALHGMRRIAGANTSRRLTRGERLVRPGSWIDGYRMRVASGVHEWEHKVAAHAMRDLSGCRRRRLRRSGFRGAAT
jgi:hypothetical protein